MTAAHSEEGRALRDLLSEFVATVPAFSAELAGRLSALAVAYPAPANSHPLTGRRAPNLQFAHTTLFDQLRDGRAVSLDFDATPLTKPHPEWSGVRAALIRPDGHVAHASDR